MIRSGRGLDPIAAWVVAAALIAWIIEPGCWRPIIGATLVGFGPGYLLLNGAAHTVSSLLVRTALYIGTSMTIAALIGLGLSAVGMPLSYASFATAYLLITTGLFALHEFEVKRGVQELQGRHQRRDIDRNALVKGSVLVAVPFLASLALLASAPVRTAASTELYFATGRGISELPTTYHPSTRLELRVIATLGAPATSEVLEVIADGRTVDSWQVPSGSMSVDRPVSVDTSRLESNPLRVEARLTSSSGQRFIVWVLLPEAP